MNILLVAPGMADINAVPEIRTITAAHRTHVYNGKVTLQMLFDTVSRNEYDVMHIAGHMVEDTSSLDEIVLSDGDKLDLVAATRIAKLGKVKLVVFNVCMAARFATYMVRNNIPCVIYTTVAIEDNSAWELPAAFYEECRRGEVAKSVLDFKTTFDAVDSGDGKYAILVGADYIINLVQTAIKPMWEALERLKTQTEKLVDDVERLAATQNKLEAKDKKRIVMAIWLFAAACGIVILCGLLYMWVTLTRI